MKKRINILLFILVITFCKTFAQGEASNWFFGYNAGLKFPGAIATTNGLVNTVEGGASVSDAAGNLLFYTDGASVWDKTNTQMSNGNGLLGDPSSTQSSLIVKKPGSATLYYIFTTDQTGGFLGLNYSVVDMSLAAGNGDVTIKNIGLQAPTSEKLTAVMHCNNTDIWIVTHDWFSNGFRCFLLSSTGVNPVPVMSSAGFVANSSDYSCGQLKATPDGSRLGACYLSNANGGKFELYDFNRATGVVFNPIALPPQIASQGAYGCEFSPDGTKFYGATKFPGKIYQWDLCAGSNAAVAASVLNIGTSSAIIGIGALQMAPDGKIYVARHTEQWLGCINNPNLSGLASNYVDFSVNLLTSYSSFGLPNFPGYYFLPAITFTPSYTSTVSCLTATFTSPVIKINNCSGSANAIISYAWNFGDIASGGSNTSSLANPIHVYSAPGTYTTNLVLNYACGSNTITNTVVISTYSIAITNTSANCLTPGSATVTVTGGGGPYTYTWTPSLQSNSVASGLSAGNYSVTVSNASGCSQTGTTAIINSGTNATVNLTATNANCTISTGSVTINSILGGIPNYILTEGSTTLATNVSPPYTFGNVSVGSHTFFVTGSSGCSTSVTASILSGTTAPNLSVTPTATIFCNPATATLNATSSATGPLTYAWAGPNIVSGNTTAAPIVSQSGNYTVTLSQGLCTNSAVVIVSQNTSTPNLSINPTSSLTCAAPIVTLTGVSAGNTIVWNSSTFTGATNPTTVSLQGTYTAVATNPVSGCSKSQTVVVNQNTLQPSINASSSSSLNCSTTIATLTGVSAGNTILWNGGALSSATNPATINAGGNYTATATNAVNGCTNNFVVNVVQIVSLPNINTSSNQTITCAVPSVTLNGSSSTAGVTFSWNPGGIASSSIVAGSAANYTLYVTDPTNGCTTSSVVNVAQNGAFPHISVTPPGTLTCLTTSLMVTGTSTTSGVNYSWSPQGVALASASVTVPGNYVFTVSDPSNGCKSVATISVSQNTNTPTLTVNSSSSLTCAAPIITLTGVSAGNTIVWSGGSLTNAPNSSTINSAAIYTALATNTLNGCSTTKTVSIGQNVSIPNITASSSSSLNCINTTATLTAISAGNSIVWSGGSLTLSPNPATITSAGIYTAIATDAASGCTNTAILSVAQNVSMPNANAGANQTITCAAPTVTLNGSSSTAGVTFSWNPGAINSTSMIAVSSGIYTLFVTDPTTGCTKTSTTNVAQNGAFPNINIAQTGTLTCSTTSLMVTGTSTTSGVNFSWTPQNVVTSTAVVSSPGNYTFIVSDPLNGCKSVASISVSQNIIPPTLVSIPTGTLTCAVPVISLTGASGNNLIVWNGNGLTNAANSSTINVPGTYTATITDAVNSCTSTQTTFIDQNIVPPTVTATSSSSLNCVVSSVTLTGLSSPGNIITWNGNGLSSASNPASTSISGIYTVDVINPQNGCSTYTTLTVVQNTTAPSASATIVGSLTCLNPSVTLNGSTNASSASYTWQPSNINTYSVQVGSASTYSLFLTDLFNGCSSSTTISVPNIVYPNISIFPPNTLSCYNTSVTLTGSSTSPGVTYSWSPQQVNTNTSIATSASNYTLTVYDPITGCSSSATISVPQNTTVPALTVNSTTSLTCLSPSIILNASSPGNILTWDGGNLSSNTPNPIIVGVIGVYSITAKNLTNGCSTTSLVNVVQNTVAPSILASVLGSLSCPGSFVNVTGSSLTSGVNYLWQPGNITSPNFTASVAGPYSLTITDPLNGCSSTTVVSVGSTPIFTSNLNILSQINCYGANNGAVQINAYSGIGPYTVINLNNNNTLGSVTSFPIFLNNLSAANYSIQVTDNGNGCSQILYANIYQPQKLTASLLSDVNICLGQTDTIDANVSGGIPSYNYQWLPETYTTSSIILNTNLTDTNTIKLYTLVVTDHNNCSINVPLTIRFHPTPNSDFAPTSLKGCVPICGTFSLNANENTGYTYHWIFSPQDTTKKSYLSSDYSASICFTDAANYDVKLTVMTPDGCTSTVTHSNLIEAGEMPNAEFYYSPNPATMVDPFIHFLNASTGATNYYWNFGELVGNSASSQSNPIHEYSQAGTYLVTLIASNKYGCVDTAYKQLQIDEDFSVYIPNTFTPNKDKVNDDWGPKGVGISDKEYELFVFDRWGEKLFSSNKFEDRWDGTYDGQLVKDDVYVYLLKCRFINSSKTVTYKGHVTVHR